MSRHAIVTQNLGASFRNRATAGVQIPGNLARKRLTGQRRTRRHRLSKGLVEQRFLSDVAGIRSIDDQPRRFDSAIVVTLLRRSGRNGIPIRIGSSRWRAPAGRRGRAVVLAGPGIARGARQSNQDRRTAGGRDQRTRVRSLIRQPSRRSAHNRHRKRPAKYRIRRRHRRHAKTEISDPRRGLPSDQDRRRANGGNRNAGGRRVRQCGRGGLGDRTSNLIADSRGRLTRHSNSLD